MTKLWKTSEGKIAKSAGNTLLDCVTCPCDTETEACDTCCDDGMIPNSITVTIPAGAVTGGGICDCTQLEGAYVCALSSYDNDPCAGPVSCAEWLLNSVWDGCGTTSIRVFLTCFSPNCEWRVIIVFGGDTVEYAIEVAAAFDCSANRTLALDLTGTISCDTYPATVDIN